MGQLSGQGAIFLSASIPDPRRPTFVGPGDVAAIGAAIKALLYVTIGRRRLVFGGHPAITSLVWAYAAASGIDFQPWVRLFQAKRFEKEFVAEVRKFADVELTPEIGALDEDLQHMRRRMFRAQPIDAAIFIGGMQGVIDEEAMLPDHVRRVALASTGGAALRIAEARGLIDEEARFRLDYIGLFSELLGIDPRERRYPDPQRQPDEVARRIDPPRPRKDA